METGDAQSSLSAPPIVLHLVSPKMKKQNSFTPKCSLKTPPALTFAVPLIPPPHPPLFKCVTNWLQENI